MKKTVGQPKFEPTQAQRDNVRVMAACGMPQDLICRQILSPYSGAPIDRKTLRRAFRAELDDGIDTANAMVARSLYQKATGDGKNSVTAAIFWLKCRAGWKDTSTIEHVGKDGGPIATVSTVTSDPVEAAAIYQKMIAGG